MKILLEFIHKAMTVIGIDATSLRNMNKPLKWIGVFIVIFFAFAAIFEPPKSPEQKAVEAVVREQQSARNEEKSTEMINNVKLTLGWLSVVCFTLAAIIEPKKPKRDGRFKTGFKNNATVRKKTPSEIRVQIAAIAIGAATGAIWYFLS